MEASILSSSTQTSLESNWFIHSSSSTSILSSSTQTEVFKMEEFKIEKLTLPYSLVLLKLAILTAPVLGNIEAFHTL